MSVADRLPPAVSLRDVSLRDGLQDELDMGSDAKYFTYEQDPMYTGKERQLVQVYMKQHGSMPPGADDLDDLF